MPEKTLEQRQTIALEKIAKALEKIAGTVSTEDTTTFVNMAEVDEPK